MVVVVTEIKDIWVPQYLLEQGHLAFVISPGSIEHIDRKWALQKEQIHWLIIMKKCKMSDQERFHFKIC